MEKEYINKFFLNTTKIIPPPLLCDSCPPLHLVEIQAVAES